jgi:hypothetical protein
MRRTNLHNWLSMLGGPGSGLTELYAVAGLRAPGPPGTLAATKMGEGDPSRV